MTQGETNQNQWKPVRPKLTSQNSAEPNPGQLKNWSLVLSARNIPFRMVPPQNPAEIHVPDEFTDIATHELELYIEENRNSETGSVIPLRPYDNTLVSLSILALLGIFHNLTYIQISAFGHPSIDWLQLGSANSAKILGGEWWRIVTALTLHADWQHLLGNILIGGYFVVRLCHLTGSGFGWALILGSGISGNLINAISHGPGHNAVGASTAIFGAIGIAGAIGTVVSRRRLARYWIMPLAAAGLLLTFLGTGNPDGTTDIGAHLFGFLSGIGLGIPGGIYLVRHGRPKETFNHLLGLASILVVIFSWIAAL